MALTVLEIEAFKCEDGQEERWKHDGGGLYLRVKTGGAKTWVFKYEFAGKQKKLTVGKYPAINLAKARELASGHRITLDGGRDPKLVEEMTAAEAHAKALETEGGEAPTTMQDLFDRWHQDYLSSSHSDGGDYVRGMFERHILVDGIAELHISLVSVAHIATIMQRMKKKKLGATTKRVLDCLRQMFVWAGSRKWITSDPTAGLKAAEFGGKVGIGSRFLKQKEITQLDHRLRKCYMQNRWKHMTWLIMATLARVEETTLAERSHFDLKNRTWTIPVSNQKKTNVEGGMQPHVIHLSEFAMRHVRALLAMPGTEKHVFPSVRNGRADTTKPANNKTLAHALGNEMGRDQDGRRATSDLLLEGGEFGPHDVRRTGSSLMRELRIESDVVDRCLNHVESELMKAIYQPAELRELMREAWDKLGAKLEELCNMPDPEPDFKATVPLYNKLDVTDPNGQARLEECKAYNAKRRQIARKLEVA